MVSADHGLDGLSLLAVAVAEGGWAFYVRTKISDGEIGDGPGWLHPLAVARSVMIAKASAWVGALVLGWWVGVLVYLLPRRGSLRVAGEDTAGAVVAAVARLRCWSRRYGCSIAASHRRSRRRMAKGPRSSWPTIADQPNRRDSTTR